MTRASVVSAPADALAAGTLVFNEPFHGNTADGLGAVVLPAMPAGSATTNSACLSASGNTTTGPRSAAPTARTARGPASCA